MNWERHFKNRSIPRNSTADFGAFLGTHTIDDLRHLLDAYDYAFSELDKSAQKLSPTDPRTAEWLSEWRTLKERYNLAKVSAVAAINEWSIQPDSIRTCPKEYELILRALQREPDAYQKGDYQDLYNRMSELLKYKPQLNMPQPKQDFDTSFMANTAGVADAVDMFVHPWEYAKKHPVMTGLSVLSTLFMLRKFLTPSILVFPGIMKR